MLYEGHIKNVLETFMIYSTCISLQKKMYKKFYQNTGQILNVKSQQDYFDERSVDSGVIKL